MGLFDFEQIEVNIRISISRTFDIRLGQTELKPLCLGNFHSVLRVQEPLVIIIEFVGHTHGLVNYLVRVAFGGRLAAVLLTLPLVRDDLAVHLLAEHLAHLHFVEVLEEVTPHHEEHAVTHLVLVQRPFQVVGQRVVVEV